MTAAGEPGDGDGAAGGALRVGGSAAGMRGDCAGVAGRGAKPPAGVAPNPPLGRVDALGDGGGGGALCCGAAGWAGRDGGVIGGALIAGVGAPHDD